MGLDEETRHDDALTRAVKNAASALHLLTPHATLLGQNVPESIQAACANLDAELTKDEVVLAVVGDASMKRAFMRLLLGENAIRDPKARRERVVRLRAGAAFDYSARTTDGSVLRFARSMPDRDPIYKKSIEDAEARVREAERARRVIEQSVEASRAAVREVENAIDNAHVELEEMGEHFADAWRAHRAALARVAVIDRAEPELPTLLKKAPAWWAFWWWLLRVLIARKWRDASVAYAQNRAESRAAHERAAELEVAANAVEAKREHEKIRRDEDQARLAHAHDALAAMEVTLNEECAVTVAEAAVESLIVDRGKHAGERRDEFFADLADFDATARGDAITEIDVELPENAPIPLPEGIALVFESAVSKIADGYVLVRDAADKSARDADVRSRLPCAVSLVVRESLKNDLARTLARIAEEKHRVVAARFALAMRACIANVQRARAAAEAEHQKRLGALEGQRIPHPDEFRRRQVTRSESAIEKGADDVLRDAIAHTQNEIEKVRRDWLDRLTNAKKKKELFSVIAEINERGKLRALELLEGTSELIAREMQSVGETLERWALDEIQQSYRVQKRVRAESLAPVTSEITAEALGFAVSPVAPAAGAIETFKRKRTRVSIGAALAGAVVGGGAGMLAGSVTRAAIGASAGMFVAALGGLVRSADPLRTECLGRVASWVDDVDRKSASLLQNKRDDIASGIRTALDDALAETFERLNEAITRLMTIEKNAIEAERATLANLEATHSTLEEHDARLQELLAAFSAS